MSRNLRARTRDALDHPLLGVDRRYTVAALAFLLALAVGIVLDDLLARGLVDVTPAALDSPIQGFIAALVVALVLSSTVVPVGYGLLNGGPVVAASLALVPQVVVAVVSGRWLLTNDFVVALLGATLGASVAVAHLLYRGRDADSPPEGLLDGLLVATALAVVAVVGTTRFAAGAPPVLGPTSGWLPAAILAVVACGGCWLAALSTWDEEQFVES